ncbi:hypothetical protein OG453_25325 [Streptomyces sp. NBC_01381]|uniref:hypothetical protein n=1 Tax=Streptomyces sp. NBC_01381 TaxID=2903845 RepID=UPI00224D0784|nr:hypothetical protein [Streptomyces sp. NBC_01381]MCX4669970.1 hypothetical protein [Streptomyces sp. NBC_01381]
MSEHPANSTPLSGLPLFLIALGMVALILATTMTPVTGTHGWRWVTVGGSAVQFTGWVLLGRRMYRQRGGAR